MKNIFWALLLLPLFSFLTLPSSQRATSLPTHALIGYWHNFDNGSGYIRLRDVSEDFDVVDIAFAVPVSGSTSQMQFSPNLSTQAEFSADVQTVQARGQKVLISIGGAGTTVKLNSEAEKQAFINSMINIIEQYGFDGLDIDLEGSSLSLDSGDTDFRSPTTPSIVNFIDAIQAIVAHFGSNFILTAAPETAFVQGGWNTYGGIWGAYLPVIHALRDDLTLLHVQHYNTGSMFGADNQIYQPATADFHVAMADMLLQDFPVGRNPNHIFPALRPDQVAIGLPASSQAAGSGYTAPAVVQQALDYLIKGDSFGGTYTISNPAGYPLFRGLMTWSVNWDAFSGFGFSTPHRAYLDGLNGSLPVELVSFDAVLDGDAVLLEWATASETNNAGFEVEHLPAVQAERQALDNWQKIAFVDGHGTTVAQQQYQYRLEEVPPGRHRFRLRQVDFDGSFAYSPEVEVILELVQAYALDAAYPNPFAHSATLHFAVRQTQQVHISLYDIQGRAIQTIFRGVVGGGTMQEATISGSQLANGVYFIRFEGEHFSETQSITVLR